MKKLLCFLVATVTLFSLSACGGTSNADSSAAKNYADEAFVEAMTKALEARWDITDSDKMQSLDSDSREHYAALSSAIDAELNIVSEYRTAEFKDHALQELAIQYINKLEESKEIADSLPSKDDKLYDKWTAVYDERTTLLQTLVNKYGLTVAEKWQYNLDDLLNNAKSVHKENEIKDKVNKLAASLKFEKKDYGYGYCTYTTKFKNDTGLDFASLSFELDLLDADGTVIEQQGIYFDNVANGKSYSGEFSTDAKFDHYEVTPEYYLKD